MDKKWTGGGEWVACFSVNVFLFHCAEEFRKGNPSVMCFRKFLVAKKFWKRGGMYHHFLSIFFCPTVPKN